MNRLFALPLIALLLATGCDSHDAMPITDKPLEELELEIRTMIEPATASRVAQCQVIAFGAKACGGPASYLVYSTARTNKNRLHRLVNEYNQRDAERNERLGLISDCLLLAPPDVSLTGGQCTAVSR